MHSRCQERQHQPAILAYRVVKYTIEVVESDKTDWAHERRESKQTVVGRWKGEREERFIVFSPSAAEHIKSLYIRPSRTILKYQVLGV